MIGTNRNGCMAVFNVENAGITKKHENKKVHIQMIKKQQRVAKHLSRNTNSVQIR